MPNWLDPELTTVFDLARSAGYATAHFGKWHLGHSKAAPAPDAYGVDDYRIIGSAGAAWKGKGKEEKDPYFRVKFTGLFVDEAIRFIKAHRDQPFYINLWTLVPHGQLNPTPEELAVYDDLQVSTKDFPC